MKKESVIIAVLTVSCLFIALVTGFFLEMLQIGIVFTILTGIVPLLGSSILEQKGFFDKENS